MPNKVLPYFFSLIAGLIYATGFPTKFIESLYITPIIGLGLYLYLLTKNSPSFKRDFLLTALFCLGANLYAYQWIPQTLLEYGKLPLAVGSLIWVAFSMVIMPHFWPLILVNHALNKWLPNFTFQQLLRSPLGRVSLCFIFVFFEYYTPTQFPSNIGSPWVLLGRYLGLASYGGVALFSAISFLISMEGINYIRTKKINIINLTVIILFIILNPLLVNGPELKDRLNIRLVQANISNFIKVQSEKSDFPSTKEVLDTYEQLSLKEYNIPGEKIDLIIWPETAYPYSIDTISTSPLPLFQKIIDKHRAQLFLGSYETDPRAGYDLFEREYNAAFLYSKKGNLIDTYHKQVLIPFGETLPFGPLTKYVKDYFAEIAFFKPGEKFTLFPIKKDIHAIAAICYEVLRPDYIRTYLNNVKKSPQLLINLTNDAWYGDTSEPHQHLFLTKWRAIENRITILRSTNSGISSVIYPTAEEGPRLNFGERGNLDLVIPVFKAAPTAYQSWGFLTLLPLFIGIALAHLLLNYKRVLQ